MRPGQRRPRCVRAGCGLPIHEVGANDAGYMRYRHDDPAADERHLADYSGCLVSTPEEAVQPGHKAEVDLYWHRRHLEAMARIAWEDR